MCRPKREILKHLFKIQVSDGLTMFDELVQSGLMSITPAIQMQMIEYVEELQRSGIKKTEAVSRASAKFGVCSDTVYKAFQKMSE